MDPLIISAVFGALAVAIAVPLSSWLLRKLVVDLEKKMDATAVKVETLVSGQSVQAAELAVTKQRVSDLEGDRNVDRESRHSLSNMVQQVLADVAVLKERTFARPRRK